MIELGDKVRDKVSGLTGITMARLEFLNGCTQYQVMPEMKKGSNEMPAWNIDEAQLENLTKKSVKIKKTKDGGPPSKVTN